MDVARLLNDELTYELLIRGCSLGNSVADKRAIMRDALHKEQNGTASYSAAIYFDPAEELSVCSGKLNELHLAIKNFDSTNRDNEAQRIRSRLYHVHTRLGRISSIELSIQQRQKELMDISISLLRELEDVYLGIQFSQLTSMPESSNATYKASQRATPVPSPSATFTLPEEPLLEVVIDEGNNSRGSVEFATDDT